MTDQLPATTNTVVPTAAPQLSARLSALLLSGDSPVIGPNSAAALREFLETPEPELPRVEQVDTLVTRLALATAQPKLSVAEAKERFRLYWIALRDLPLPDLRAAFVVLVRTQKFLPTPAEVRTEAIRQGSVRLHAKSRARQLIWLHEREWTPPAEPVPQDELKALLSNVKTGLLTAEGEDNE